MNVKLNGESVSFEINKWLAGVIVAGMSGWLSFMTYQLNSMATAVSDRPDRAEVKSMIAEYAPYQNDRLVIMDRIARLNDAEEKTLNVVKNNTAAMQEMRLEFERFRSGFTVMPRDVLRELKAEIKAMKENK